VLVLVFQAAAFAQRGEPLEVICPVDGYHFRIPVGERGDRNGGKDSDECPHDRRGQTLPHMLMVCPRCNYAASSREFLKSLTDEERLRVLHALASSEYRGVANSLTEIPGWERFRLAAMCAEVLKKEQEQLEYLEFAAWSARVEACRPASVAYSSPARKITPLGQRISEWEVTRPIADVIREIKEEMKGAKKPREKHRLMLHLAMMYERAGFAAERDKVLGQLEKSAESGSLLTRRVSRFRNLVAVETDFQKQVVALAQERLAKLEARWERATTNYLIADTLRRLGKDAEAVKHYRAARKLLTRPSETRIYVDHFLSMLAPGEPLPTPEPEEEEKAEKTPATPPQFTTEPPEVPKQDSPKE